MGIEMESSTVLPVVTTATRGRLATFGILIVELVVKITVELILRTIWILLMYSTPQITRQPLV
jgi:hypothetical protein